MYINRSLLLSEIVGETWMDGDGLAKRKPIKKLRKSYIKGRLGCSFVSSGEMTI
jgi:hypothetical protein